MEVTDIKTTGIVREIDDFGRVVPPAEWRRINGIENGSKVDRFLPVTAGRTKGC